MSSYYYIHWQEPRAELTRIQFQIGVSNASRTFMGYISEQANNSQQYNKLKGLFFLINHAAWWGVLFGMREIKDMIVTNNFYRQ